VGDAGAGKSMLIKGMFPGLELSNDDEGVNIRPLPLIKSLDNDFFSSHTYHLDVRFEMAFTQMHKLIEAIKKAIELNKRVIIEHFDLIYPYLDSNAEILIGIGEEVIVTRPNIFGPVPNDIANIVFKSLKNRKMAHTAEDITAKVLEKEYNIIDIINHNDVKHGFVIESLMWPKIDIIEIEKKVKAMISDDIDIFYIDDNHISIGKDNLHICTGPRIHVRNTSEILNFQLIKELKFNPITKLYALVGLVGDERPADMKDLNKITL
jgi:hypothetical protein